MLRLRFDKVALGVIERLKAAVDPHVPVGVTVFVTITAPIRLASKTTAAVETEIRTLLARRPRRRERRAAVFGNQVRIRLLERESRRSPRVIVFVHNPDADWRALLKMAAGNGASGRTRPGRRSV